MAVRFLLLLGSLSLIALGCTKSDEQRLENIEKRLSDIELSLGQQQFLEDWRNEIWIYPRFGDGFQTLETGNGIFFVSVDDFEREWDRYNFSIRIGNPSAIAFPEAVVKLRWCDSDTTNHDYSLESPTEWKEREVQLAGSLRPGAWTPVEFSVSPVSDTGELGLVKLSLDVSTIRLRAAQRTP